MNLINVRRLVISVISIICMFVSQANDSLLVTPLKEQSRAFFSIEKEDHTTLRQGKIYFNSLLLSQSVSKANTIQATIQPLKTEVDFLSRDFILKLFADTAFSVTLTDQKTVNNITTYQGKTNNSSVKNVFITLSGNAYSIAIDDDYRYEIKGNLSNKVGEVIERDTSKERLRCDSHSHANLPNFAPMASLQKSSAKALFQATANFLPQKKAKIKLMFVYDNMAQTWLNNEYSGNSLDEKMTLFSTERLSEINQAFENSQLNIDFEIVQNMTINKSYSGDFFDYIDEVSALLPAWNDRFFDSRWFARSLYPYPAIRNVRNRYHADLVIYLSDEAGYRGGGVAPIARPWGIQSRGHSVMAIDSVKTMMHELGHTLGAAHAASQSKEPGPNRYFGNYAAGSYFSAPENNKNYGSVMSYTTSEYSTRAKVFSSPVVTYRGAITGNSANADNRRVVAQMANTIAAYRHSPNEEVTLDEALDRKPNSLLNTFTTSGDASWYGQTDYFFLDGDAAKVPELAYETLSLTQKTTSIKTKITAPRGVLSFYSKGARFTGEMNTSGQFTERNDGDYALYINGDKKIQLNSVYFKRHAINLDLAGEVNIEWRYTRGNGGYNWQTAWLDEVSFMPTPDSSAIIDINEAVDNTELTFTVGSSSTKSGQVNWFGQAAESSDGEDAVQSGFIGDNEASWFETQVQGPGIIRFKVKTSSQANADRLLFTVDNHRRTTLSADGISGSQTEYTSEYAVISSGQHSLRWTYQKDASAAGHQDAVWIDNIVYEKYNEVPLSSVFNDANFILTSSSTGASTDKDWFARENNGATETIIRTSDNYPYGYEDNVTDSPVSNLTLTMNTPNGGTLSFSSKVSVTNQQNEGVCEYGLAVKLNSVTIESIPKICGEQPFQALSVNIPEGEQVVEWAFNGFHEKVDGFDNMASLKALNFAPNVRITPQNPTSDGETLAEIACSETLVTQLNTAVTCTVSNINSLFNLDAWLIDGCTNDTSCTFTPTEDTLVSVRLIQKPTVSISTSTGENGTIIDCPTEAIIGQTITCTAKPDEHYYTDTWQGCEKINENSCQLTVAESSIISVTFSLKTYSISAVSDNKGRIDCPTSAKYGETVTCSAYPVDGYRIDEWSDNCIVLQDGSCQLTIEGDTDVSVSFIKNFIKGRIFDSSFESTD